MYISMWRLILYLLESSLVQDPKFLLQMNMIFWMYTIEMWSEIISHLLLLKVSYAKPSHQA